VSVKVQGKSNDWMGSVSYSLNGGDTYVAMTCPSCSGPSNSAANMVVDGDNNFLSGVDTRCVEGAICTLVKRPLNCVQVVTGGGYQEDGPLTVYVDAGSGQVQEASGSHDKNAIVVDKCYDTKIFSVNAKAESGDAWVGSITHSYDGGHRYDAMECSDCNGTTTTAGRIEFDGDNDDITHADTHCFGGTLCTIVQLKTTTTTTIYILRPEYDNDASSSYFGHNGLAVGMQVNVTSGTKWSIQSVGEINNSRVCTLQAVTPQDSGASYLSSNGSAVLMVSTADTVNEKWTIAGFC